MEKYSKRKSATILSLFMIGIMVGVIFMANMNVTEIITSVGQRGWRNVASAEGNPGTGASGVLEILIYPHSADPGTDYATNLSNATAYGHTDNLNTSAGSSIPFATTFDIVMKVRFNATHAYNTTGSKWMDAWVQANITCADLSIGAFTPMTWLQTDNTSTYMWGNFYVNGGGAGYTITHSEHVNVTLLRISAYF